MNALICLSALGIMSLFAEIFNLKKFLWGFVLAGIAITFGLNMIEWNTGISYYNNMMLFDNFAVAFTGVILFTAFLWFVLSPHFFKEQSSKTDHFALILFALAGAVVMVSYSNMVMLFLGIEILSLSVYVLAGSRKSDTGSNEAALKYFLMGSFATGFLLLGIALIYGATGSFDLKKIAEFLASNSGSTPAIFYAGVLLMMAGLAFKISAVPFHFWTPDVYQGSPTAVTSYMATIVKTAAIAAFFRLFFTCFSSLNAWWSTTIWVLAALTIITGNLTAVYQKNIKRMLAYSGISHAGYMLIAILAMNKYSMSAVLFYSIAYSVASMAAFAVVLIVEEVNGNADGNSFRGLAKRNPLLAFSAAIAMLSLAGIPPTAGFFAKYYLFAAAIQNGQIGIVIIAILGSLIGVFYYFRVIVSMYSDVSVTSNPADSPITLGFNYKALLIITTILAILLGILPNLVLDVFVP